MLNLVKGIQIKYRIQLQGCLENYTMLFLKRQEWQHLHRNLMRRTWGNGRWTPRGLLRDAGTNHTAPPVFQQDP